MLFLVVSGTARGHRPPGVDTINKRVLVIVWTRPVVFPSINLKDGYFLIATVIPADIYSSVLR